MGIFYVIGTGVVTAPPRNSSAGAILPVNAPNIQNPGGLAQYASQASNPAAIILLIIVIILAVGLALYWLKLKKRQ